jgi:hypothetical protein
MFSFQNREVCNLKDNLTDYKALHDPSKFTQRNS